MIYNKNLFILILLVLFIFKYEKSTAQTYQCLNVGQACPNPFTLQSINNVDSPITPIPTCHSSTCQINKGITECTDYLKLNELCNSTYGGCDPSLVCDSVSGKCLDLKYKQIGDTCSDTSECYGELECQENSVCVNIRGDYCRNDGECSYNYYCDENSKCQQYVELSGDCSTYGCVPGTVCNQDLKCEKIFTLSEDDECTDYLQCKWEDSLTCTRQGTCKKYQETDQTLDCTQDDICNNFEYCDSNTKKCITTVHFTSECQNFYLDYYQCLAENQCHDSFNFESYSENSCTVKNCGYEFCGISSKCKISPCQNPDLYKVCSAYNFDTNSSTSGEPEISSSNILMITNIIILLSVTFLHLILLK